MRNSPKAVKDIYEGMGKLSGGVLLGVRSLRAAGALYCGGRGLTVGGEWEVLNFNTSSMVMLIYLDWMACVFLRAVTLISGLVLIYRDLYMGGDKYLNRFVLLVVMFVVSMVLLIVSPNLLRMLLGWDGLGLVSYCLVIYYQRTRAFNAGILTALTNRVGDVMLLMGIAWWFRAGG